MFKNRNIKKQQLQRDYNSFNLRKENKISLEIGSSSNSSKLLKNKKFYEFMKRKNFKINNTDLNCQTAEQNLLTIKKLLNVYPTNSKNKLKPFFKQSNCRSNSKEKMNEAIYCKDNRFFKFKSKNNLNSWKPEDSSNDLKIDVNLNFKVHMELQFMPKKSFPNLEKLPNHKFQNSLGNNSFENNLATNMDISPWYNALNPQEHVE